MIIADKSTLEAALTTVIDDPYLTQYIYPIMAEKLSGRELNEQGVALAFDFAVYDACRERELPASVNIIFSMNKDKFLRVIQEVSHAISSLD